MEEDEDLKQLRQQYLYLINKQLPAAIKQPVRFNHCFARIVLDHLHQQRWDEVIQQRPAYKQLNAAQLQQAIVRMEQWLREPELVFADNEQSLRWRGKLK